MQRKIQGRKAEAGFTLIELLVVVLIIGILASVAIPQYFAVVEKGKLVEAKAWIGSVKSAEERYYNQYGNYTALITDLDIKMGVNDGLKFYTSPVLAPTPGACSGGDDGFTITLTRQNLPKNKAPSKYGVYTVQFNSCSAPGAAWIYTCPGSPCQTDFE